MRPILTTITLFSYILQAQSSSRYFVYTLSAPLGDPKYVPYPLDVCINYAISTSGFLHMTINHDYAKFTCNDNNNQITMMKYGSDSTCSSIGTVDQTYTNDFSNPGDLYSFNCIGDDNYAENHIYQSDDTCCGLSFTAQKAATNVCVMNSAKDGTYSMATCDTNSTISYKYNSLDCNIGTKNNTPEGIVYDNQCVSIKNQWTPIYIRMDKCIVNGEIVDKSKFCHTTTVSPTMDTNSPSHMPSASPTTVSPTKDTNSPTVSPTNAPTTTMDAKLVGSLSLMHMLIIGSIILVLLVVGIGVYCVMRRRKLNKQHQQSRVGLINDEVENDKPIQQAIAMDNVVRNENEDDDDQVIVGTADEIVIANFNDPPR